MRNGSNAITVIENGTLIDGTGGQPVANKAIVIEGNRITNVGELPAHIDVNGPTVHVIDASGRWVMPGLIDAHCHLSFGFPEFPGVPGGRGTANPEMGTIRAAINAREVLRAGITSIAVPGGTWFIDVALRDAINTGLLEGPRIACAGRFIVTYGSIIDNEPSWVGTPEHSVGVLANSVPEMITEVRRQIKHGVDFIKLADSTWGDSQTISREELSAVVGEAHRRNTRVFIHSRGTGSTRDATEAGVDCILHADLATDEDLEAVAEAGIPILPAATFLERVLESGWEDVATDEETDLVKRNLEGVAGVIEKCRGLGIRVLAGTDSGNSDIMPYGKYHAREAALMVRESRYSPLEAISAFTRDNAWAVGLDGEVGTIEEGKLADLTVWNTDPVADIRVLQDTTNLETVIKDGKMVDLNGHQAGEELSLALASRGIER